MINRVTDVFPQVLCDELLRLGKLDPHWMKWEFVGKGEQKQYRSTFKVETWLKKLCRKGQDNFGMWAASIWLVSGPKIFRPTVAQCDALEQVEVRLQLPEYAQPYPAILIDLPKDKYAPFIAVLCHRDDQILTCQLLSESHHEDIVTTVAEDGRAIEESLVKFDEGLESTAVTAALALRVAVNACLALVNFGCHAEYLYGKQAANDQRLINEQSERGKRARDRLRTAIKVVSFKQDILLHRTERTGERGQATGREMPFHWRKGHWRMQHYGVGNALVKRILLLPVMVRADKLTVDPSETSVTYRG